MAADPLDALIDSLAEEVRPVRRASVSLRLAFGVLAGGAVTAVLVLILLGPRRDLAAALSAPSIWMKWGYTAALAAIALAAAQRLARPGARGGRSLWLAAVPLLIVAALALRELSAVPPGGWSVLWLGHSWRVCPLLVMALAGPIFLGLVWAFRGFAPTRLRLAGSAAGLAAGASAATLYGFACAETSALFLVTWYTLGIVGATALGALLGPRLLRW